MRAILTQHLKQSHRPHLLFVVDLANSMAMTGPVAVVADVTQPPIRLVKCHHLAIQKAYKSLETSVEKYELKRM